MIIWHKLNSRCILNQLKSLNLEGLLETLNGVVQVINYNLGSRRVIKLKKNLCVLRWNLRKEALLKIENLHVTCGKRHYRESLTSTGSCFGYGKYGHKVRDCPTISSRWREGTQDAPNNPKCDATNKRRSYALRTGGAKPDEDDYDGNSFYFSLV